MKKKQTCITLSEDWIVLLRKYSGEVTAKTGKYQSLSDLIEDAVKEKFSFLIQGGK